MRLRKKALVIALILISVIIVLFMLTIKVKHAVIINFSEKEITFSLDSLIGQQVVLLCMPAGKEVTEPPEYNFVALAVESEDGIFERIPIKTGEKVLGTSGIYLHPAPFIGRTIQNYNYGATNQFLFRGILSRASEERNDAYPSDYNLELSSWDIVYPVYHWELAPFPDNDFSKKYMFLFDYVLP